LGLKAPISQEIQEKDWKLEHPFPLSEIRGCLSQNCNLLLSSRSGDAKTWLVRLLL